MTLGKIIRAIISVVFLAAVCAVVTYSADCVCVNGRAFDFESKYAIFTGSEITDPVKTARALSVLPNLESVSFGSYTVEAENAEEVRAALPDVDMHFDTHVTVYKKKVPTSAAEVDLSDATVKSADELVHAMKYLTGAQKVSLGSCAVPCETKRELIETYPNVEFDVVGLYYVCGSPVRDDDKTVNLSDREINVEEFIQSLAEVPGVEYVDLTGCGLSADDKKTIGKAFPEIAFKWEASLLGTEADSTAEEIDLSGTDLSGRAAELDENLWLYNGLKSMKLYDCGLTPDEQQKLVAAHPTITFHWNQPLGNGMYDSAATELDISGQRIGEGRIDELKEQIRTFKNLTYLNMSDCGISDEAMAQLRADVPNVKIVWRLYLGRWNLMTDQVAFSVLIWTYDYRPMNTRDIQVLKYCTDLRALDLGHQWISDISVIGDYLTELRVLILADNALTDISPIGKLKHLHYLEFFVNQVTDISPLENCTELVDLNISYNHGLSDIKPILKLPMLERLWLEHCAVSAEDCELLRATYPNATVVTEGKGSVDQGWRGHERYYAMYNMFLYDRYALPVEFSKYG